MKRLQWTLHDAWTIAKRDLRHWRLQPGLMAIGWLFPVMTVLMFGGLFGGAISVPDGGKYFDFLMPGMFATTMLFGLEATVVAVTSDKTKGITDRFRSMPISAAAVVLGRCMADMLNSVVGLMVMIVTGLLLGWRWHDGLAPALAAFGLLILLRFALLWFGVYLGLMAKGPESVVAVQILVWPFTFLSNVFVDPTTMPSWLGAIAEWNPLSVTGTTMRELFQNPGWQSGETWASENALLMALIWPALLILIFLPLSARKYRRLNQ